MAVSYLAYPACLALALTSCSLHNAAAAAAVAVVDVAADAAAAAIASCLACMALFSFEKAWWKGA